MMAPFTFLASILFLVATCIQEAFPCGYASCPSAYNSSQLHLHIIAHSHDDVGWLEKADSYASNNANPILSAVTEALLRNFDRKFVQVEMYYFSRWWQRQSLDVQEVVKKQVKTGQLTFAGGGWCVNDEATTSYGSIIDQMSLGIDFIAKTFGECAVPKLSWQIDPFGASKEAAHLFALMGFDAHVTNRGNDQLFGEFLWNTSSDGREIFTTRTHHHYHAPDGFNFEDADEITEANKHAKAKTLVELGRKWNTDYGSKGHVLMTFGHDFSYKHAERWFSNLDKLIKVVNADYPDVHLHYSSPHCYVKAVRDLKTKLPVKSADFFPYWTGYFSSRPLVKYLDRFAGNLLSAAKQLDVLAALTNGRPYLYEARNQLAVLQHHDAITGTSRPEVMLDYKQRLVSSLKASSAVISQALAKLTSKSSSSLSTNEPFIYTTVNISDFTAHLNTGSFAIIIYNPLAQAHSSWIRIPVTSSAHYKVLSSNGTELQQVSLVPINDKVKAMVGHHQEVTHELVFETHLLPALGFTTFFVVKESANSPVHKVDKLDTDSSGHFLLNGSNFQLTIDHKTGGILSILRGSQNHHLMQKFAYYTAHRSSDSYRFCPTKAAFDLNNETIVQNAKYDGFSEVTQKVNEWIWQTIRVYENRPYVELDWIVGPIDDKDGVSKEVISRFETKLQTNGTWYTDANGRQMMPRHRSSVIQTCNGFKETYSMNYYPVTSQAAIKDELMSNGPTMSLFTDRSVGAASQTDGVLELMLHRRLLDHLGNGIDMNDLDDDGKGVVARGKVLLMFSDDEAEVADERRQLSRALANQPVIAFQSIKSSVQEYQKLHNLQFSALTTPLPANLHLLTLENVGLLKDNQIRLRVENIYERSDKSKLAVENMISLDTFSYLKFQSINKVNLLGLGTKTKLNNHQLTLKPNEIGTYILNLTQNLSPKLCSLKWEHLHENKNLPAHSVIAGHESNGSPLYVCRHPNSENLLPGKYSHTIHCRISNGGQEIIFNDEKIEVLVDSNGANSSVSYQWVPRHGGDAVSDDAFVAGHAHGVPIYIGRCAKDGLVVGKIDEYFYYAYGRKEHKDCVDHQILTC